MDTPVVSDTISHKLVNFRKVMVDAPLLPYNKKYWRRGNAFGHGLAKQAHMSSLSCSFAGESQFAVNPRVNVGVPLSLVYTS